jgi:hypothetical protein
LAEKITANNRNDAKNKNPENRHQTDAEQEKR